MSGLIWIGIRTFFPGTPHPKGEVFFKNGYIRLSQLAEGLSAQCFVV
jgi:hypothetical protein